MYVDEIGNADLDASEDPLHRYLSLTGVIFDRDDMADKIHPRLEQLKREFFGHHPDEPVILHRKEMLNKKRHFRVLHNDTTRARWDQTLFAFLQDSMWIAITVVIDKLEHNRRYSVWHHDPYHYAMEVLLERYVLYLEGENVRGDVMSEARGGKEDRRLKASFQRLWNEGTDFVAADRFQLSLTSKELKVKQKSANLSGLQIADLIAHPSYKVTLLRQQRQKLPDGFGGRIARMLESTKYHRNPVNGKIDGWGRKWLP